MANTKITDLTANTAPAASDLLPMVDDPGGTPLSQKITFANASKAITPEGTNVLSTGEAGAAKFLREDGDGTSSWQALPAAGAFTLPDATDVTIAAPADNNLLTYDNGTSQWTNQTAAQAGVAAASHTHTKSDLTDVADFLLESEVDADIKTLSLPASTTISAFGASIIDDADEATFKATVNLEIGTDVQAQGATLTSLEGLTLGAGDLLYATAADTLADLAIGTAGHVLTVNAGATAPEWAAAAGGSGQTTVTRIVAASGGDHTTLGAAITAASAGDTIYVRAGTYTESAITSSLADLTIIGEGRAKTILTFTTANLTLTGANLTLQNLQIQFSTGVMVVSGANCVLSDWNLVTSDDGISFTLDTGTGSRISNMYYYDGSSTFANHKILISQAHASITGSYFYLVNQGGSLANASVKLNANYITVAGNTFRYRLSGTNGCHLTTTTSANSCEITGNTFLCDSGSFDTGIYITGNYNNVVGNTVREGYYGINIAGTYSNVSGNTVQSSQGGYGIGLGEHYCSATGNLLRNTGSAGTGMKTDGGRTDCVFNDNFVSGFATGIAVESGSDRTTVVGNNLVNNTAMLTDAGDRTNSAHNVGATTTLDKTMVRMKNTSGGTLNAGDLVVFKSVANGDEITTTTTGGDNKVFGMVADSSIASTAYGYIQTLGKTTALKVDGTTDIAIGDYISCFTTAKYGQKATTGHMAIAIALEAFITDASSGTIDALLITPRLI